jgi:hypothetical protein
MEGMEGWRDGGMEGQMDGRLEEEMRRNEGDLPTWDG